MENQAEALRAIGLKIETLSQKIGSISKDGHNEFQNFDFISSEAMVRELRKELLSHHLSIVPSVSQYEERESINDKGKQVIRSIVMMDFKIIDLETGFQMIEQFVGSEQDTGGKSMQQAITQCTKYFYFKLFKVSSKDEVDGDRNHVTASKATGSTKASQGASNAASDLDPDGKPKQWLNANTEEWDTLVEWASKGLETRLPKVRDKFKVSKANYEKLEAEAKALFEAKTM
jgi:hypothetical protein